MEKRLLFMEKFGKINVVAILVGFLVGIGMTFIGSMYFERPGFLFYLIAGSGTMLVYGCLALLIIRLLIAIIRNFRRKSVS